MLCDEASGARKAELPNMVMLKQEDQWQLVTCGQAVFGGPGGPRSSPQKGTSPTLGATK